MKSFYLFAVVVFAAFELALSQCARDNMTGVPEFGESCGFQCHCFGNVTCNQATGQCPDDCEEGWMGPGCQFANVAYSRDVFLTRPFNAETAGNLSTDGTATTCSQSVNMKNPSLTVDLVISRHVSDIRLVIPDTPIALAKMAAFKVFVRTPNTTTLVLCYEHDGSSLTPEIEIKCQTTILGDGIVVNFKKRTTIYLCEIQVMGGRHLSYSRATAQKTTIHPSYNAVDGRINQTDACACLTKTRLPWWRVDLGDYYLIEGMKIFIYIDVPFIAEPLIIDVEYDFGQPIENVKMEKFIYSFPPIIEVSYPEPVVGRYIRLWLNARSSRLSICEVFVQGVCFTDQCGLSCSDVCLCKSSQTRQEQLASICNDDGCRDGTPPVNNQCLSACPKNKWGPPECNKDCGNCADGHTCDVISGECPGQCAAEFAPPMCTDCRDGFHLSGLDCIPCGNCLDNEPCETSTGQCNNGCAAGFVAPLCKEACAENTWGPPDCSKICGSCADGVPCDFTSGECPGQCAAGFVTSMCNECVDGNYGDLCDLTCGSCINTKCLRFSGVCLDGCAAGFNPPFCKNTCSDGNWGINCENLCGYCSDNKCDVISGECLNGCKEGRKETPLCDEGCTDGFHLSGTECIPCGNCFENEPCDPSTGQCITGCAPGFLAPLCKLGCPAFKFGIDCVGTCGHCLDGKPCTPDSGECPNGCVSGYDMPYCSSPSICPPDKNNNAIFGADCDHLCHCKGGATCDHETGNCPAGCAEGWTGPACQYANLAYSKSASMTSPAKNKIAAMATDGDESTCTWSSTKLDPFISVDLEIPRYVTDVRLVLLNQNTPLTKMAGFIVLVSLSTNSSVMVCYEHDGTEVQPVNEITCVEPAFGDTVTVTFKSKNTVVYMCELEVLGGREVSFGLEVSQSSTQFSAEFATDGLVGENSVCSLTENSNDPWMRVDLQRVHQIDGLRIYLPGVFGIAENLVIEIELEAGIKLNGVTYDTQYNDVTDVLEVSLIAPIMGRYVKLHVPGVNQFLSICEVIVLADCAPDKCGLSCTDTCLCKSPQTKEYILAGVCYGGCRDRVVDQNGRCEKQCSSTTWGPTCSNTCGACADGEPCDVTTGDCVNGCAPFYDNPPFCKECAAGRYGENCLLECGNCAGPLVCRSDNGECSEGCKTGWTTAHCNVSVVEPIPQPEAIRSSNAMIPIIIGVVVGVAVVLALIVLIVIVLKRRAHVRRETISSTSYQSTSDIYFNPGSDDFKMYSQDRDGGEVSSESDGKTAF